MKKLSVSIITSFIILVSFFSTLTLASGDINTNTTEGNHLFTSKFEGNGKFCTAVAINTTTYLTAAHCVDYKSKEGSIGKVYPALSGISTPLSEVNIGKAIVYEENQDSAQVSQSKDLAILKAAEPLPTSLEHYLKGRTPNISGVLKDRTKQGEKSLIDKSVYSIGYSSSNGNNYSTKFEGKITDIYIDGHKGTDESTFNKSGLIKTDLHASGGQSGSGLFLKDDDDNEQNDELIGILSSASNDDKDAKFALITSKVKEWIDKNKN
ncbi:serine protease [Staphylococcus agnetis]|uniref:trypsin-like serine peptidase n=1 Tax=Staphylococcus agnetis TaxID=985762 RepID=UPI00208F401A|nr:trypsin-like serine protease [Staphylococcus agnetis]MCO4342151.1 serine protease [Staphylococcus agnetis]MCO4344350.1 serine protease [Staphylococcus agnetis]MCO4351500.1 serine protease [Staphylococcus agnetis]MCO4368114.1 serine protease [Staphylococcus agnetis]